MPITIKEVHVRATIGFFLVSSLMSGCVEFIGTHGTLGFESTLKVDGVDAWTPESGILSGARARFTVVSRADQESTATPDVSGRAQGVKVITTTDDSITITGQRSRGSVTFDGEVLDSFRVAFRPAKTAYVVDPTLTFAKVDARLPDRFGVAGPYTITAALRDRRGRALGYDPAAVTLIGGTTSVIGSESGLELCPMTTDDFTVDVGGMLFPGPEVIAISPDAVESLTLETHALTSDEGEPFWLVRAVGHTAADLPVYGLEVDWTWEGDGQNIQSGWVAVTDLASVSGTWDNRTIEPS